MNIAILNYLMYSMQQFPKKVKNYFQILYISFLFRKLILRNFMYANHGFPLRISAILRYFL